MAICECRSKNSFEPPDSTLSAVKLHKNYIPRQFFLPRTRKVSHYSAAIFESNLAAENFLTGSNRWLGLKRKPRSPLKLINLLTLWSSREIFLVSFHCSRRLSFSRREHEFTGGLLHRRGDLPIEIPKKAQRQWSAALTSSPDRPLTRHSSIVSSSQAELSSRSPFRLLVIPRSTQHNKQKSVSMLELRKEFSISNFCT